MLTKCKLTKGKYYTFKEGELLKLYDDEIYRIEDFIKEKLSEVVKIIPNIKVSCYIDENGYYIIDVLPLYLYEGTDDTYFEWERNFRNEYTERYESSSDVMFMCSEVHEFNMTEKLFEFEGINYQSENPKDYILKELNQVSKRFKNSCFRYKEEAGTHIIDVKPSYLYDENEDYEIWEVYFHEMFTQLYPDENIEFRGDYNENDNFRYVIVGDDYYEYNN